MKNRHFVITVNQKRYEVSIEEGLLNREKAPKAQKAQKAPKAEEARETGEHLEMAPMPGTIVDVRVKPGDQVSKGQTLVVLEAMKMENEIPAKVGGVVTEVKVAKGAAVGNGDPLVVIDAK